VKVDKRYKIHEASTKEAGRYAMHNVSLEIPREGDPTLDGAERPGILAATNGRILAVLPVDLDETDTPGLVPREAFELACKTPSKGHTVKAPGIASVEVNGGVVVRSVPGRFEGLDRVDDCGEFPQWRAVLPPDEGIRIAFNPQLFFQLLKAIGADKAASVTLTLSAEGTGSSPIRVQGRELIGDTNATRTLEGIGVIMPITVD